MTLIKLQNSRDCLFTFDNCIVAVSGETKTLYVGKNKVAMFDPGCGAISLGRNWDSAEVIGRVSSFLETHAGYTFYSETYIRLLIIRGEIEEVDL